MRVSIIMPVYNCAPYLRESIASVVAQTYMDWELICVDDASTDDSLSVLREEAERDQRIKIEVLATNSGAAKARNRGIDLAKGELIAFLDADDLWHPDKLLKQVEKIQLGCAFVCTTYSAMKENGEIAYQVVPPERVEFRETLKGSAIGCSTVLLCRDLIGDLRMPDIRKRQDYAFWLLLLQKIGYACGIQEELCTYRIRKDSISRNKLKVLPYQWRVYRDILRMGFIKSSYYFMYYALTGIRRRFLKNG